MQNLTASQEVSRPQLRTSTRFQCWLHGTRKCIRLLPARCRPPIGSGVKRMLGDTCSPPGHCALTWHCRQKVPCTRGHISQALLQLRPLHKTAHRLRRASSGRYGSECTEPREHPRNKKSSFPDTCKRCLFGDDLLWSRDSSRT